MPQINRVRVNNINYNDGTQRYDDFLMKFECRNALYDLVNGGGKSILLMLILQTVLPNQELDKKQPLSKLFIKSNNNNTIHSMVEWHLDKEAKERFKANYLLTGFCAKKGGEGKGEVEYFNYTITYNDYNDYDIKNFELADSKEKINFTNMRKKLRSMQEGNFIDCRVELFETNESYKRRLAEYGIYESHWNIVRGINESEGHVRTYIEKNYKSSRQLIDKLLITEIIEKANIVKLENKEVEGELANSLIDIQDKLMELSQKKKDKDKYVSQVEVIDKFIDKLGEYENGLSERITFITDFKKVYIDIEENYNFVSSEYASVKEKIGEKQEEERYEKRYLELLRIEQIKKTLLTAKEEYLELEELYKKAENADKIAMEELRFTEAKSAYIKYKDAFIQFKTIENEIKHKQDSTKDKLDAIKGLILVKKKCDKLKIRKLDEIITNNGNKLIEYDSILKEYVTELGILNQETGSNNALITLMISNLDADKESLKELSTVLDKNLAILEDDNVIIKDEDRRDKYINDKESDTKKQQHNDSMIAVNKDKLEALKGDKIKLEAELEYKKSILSDLENKINEYNQKKQHFDKIKSLLKLEEQVSIDSVINYISIAENEAHKSIFECRVECDRLSAKISALKEGKIGVDNEDLMSVYSFLSKSGGSVMIGSNYIKDKAKEEKEELLSRLPILPYSVIVDDILYSKLGKTINLDSIYLDNIIPVICSKAINQDTVCNTEDIIYLHNDVKLFINDEYLSMEIDKLCLELHKKEKEKENHSENIAMYQTYHAEAVEFRNSYASAIDENEKLYTENKSIIIQLEAEISKLAVQISELLDTTSKLEEDNNRLISKLAILVDTISILDKRIECYNQVDSGESQLVELKNKATRDKKQIENIQIDSNRVETEVKNLEAENKELNMRKDEIQRIWNEKYLAYSDENVELEDNSYAEALTEEELTSELNGAIDAYEKDNADVLGSRRACEAYKSSMIEYKNQITKSQYTIEYFEEYEKDKGEIVCTELELSSKEELCKKTKVNFEKARNELVDKDKKNSRIESELEITRDNYNKLFGQIELGSKHGEPVIESNDKDNIENAIREHKNRWNMLSGEVKGLEKSERELRIETEDYSRLLSNQQEYARAIYLDLERSHNIAKEHIKIEAIRTQVDKAKKNIKINDDKCIRVRNKCKEQKERCSKEIAQLNAEYAYQIEKLEIPSEVEELGKQIEDYRQSRDYLVDEIHQIDKSLEEIIEIKNKFNKKCIQKSLSIKGDIDKFGKYSRMIIDSEEVQAVKLKIHYYPEDIQTSKMERYIDKIVEDTSKIENDEEKKKILREKLSGKSLFGVIINDAAGIELSLYKRERIKENSRHLKYEEAVGSTGQSQGIYILLIIALVNYISKMYSNETDEGNITKTIFIDNPFGAAKDVYIWEPILSMLRDNNVQLIIPTRGVTPAMTSKFDIYYTLGQKMSGNKMQTVVVNYESNVENEKVEYTRTETEQIDMFSVLEMSE